MKPSYQFFENRDCKYFPCHDREGDFNCLFCYCPLYQMEHCPGKPTYVERSGNKIKVCTKCSFPHDPANYEQITSLLKTKSDT